MIDNKPLVSVILPVFNSQKYLKDSIESILNQTYTKIEIVCINDGSTDISLKILESYSKMDKRIKIISHENKGIAYSLNQGIKQSNGDYIARMDADDIAVPTRIEEQVEFLERNSKIGICGSWAEVFGNNDHPKLLKHPGNHERLRVKLLFSVCFAHPTVMIRRSLLTGNSICYNEKFTNSQDYELWSKIITFNNYVKYSKSFTSLS